MNKKWKKKTMEWGKKLVSYILRHCRLFIFPLDSAGTYSVIDPLAKHSIIPSLSSCKGFVLGRQIRW
jgi:hypothetical protein